MRGKQGEEMDHKVLVLNYLMRLGRRIKEDAKDQVNRGWEG